MGFDTSRYVDEFGNTHFLGEEIGSGGQGAVFRTQDADLAIKLSFCDGHPRSLRYFSQLLLGVRLLPIPRNMYLARPIALLRERTGYVMRLLNSMKPFWTFWPNEEYRPPEIPDWLAGCPEEGALRLVHFRDTGGMRHRLEALYKGAATLSRLHALGLVYGDVSPANVFISSKPDTREAWLIDADNLRYEDERNPFIVYTPGFGAPEVVRGESGVNQRTDVHAFAVMAFWMLSTVHPFYGDCVDGEGDADWADDTPAAENREEMALAGLFPWIDDPDDDRNSTRHGLPRGLVLTEELSALFQDTFGVGRTDPSRRPSMLLWPQALARALDQSLVCPACRMSYYCEKERSSAECPYCGAAAPPRIHVTAWATDAIPQTADIPTWMLAREGPHASKAGINRAGPGPSEGFPPLLLPQRLFQPFSLADGDNDHLAIRRDGQQLVLQVLDDNSKLSHSVSRHGGGPLKFRDFASTMVLEAEQWQGGFWLRVAGNHPRILLFTLEGSFS